MEHEGGLLELLPRSGLVPVTMPERAVEGTGRFRPARRGGGPPDTRRRACRGVLAARLLDPGRLSVRITANLVFPVIRERG